MKLQQLIQLHLLCVAEHMVMGEGAGLYLLFNQELNRHSVSYTHRGLQVYMLPL